MALTTKQQVFVEAYLTCWNASEAARQAGYSAKSAGSIGQENLTKPEIAEAIRARLVELKASADEVVVRLTEQARGSIAPFLDINAAGQLTGFDFSEGKPLHLLKKASVTKRTYNEITEETTTIELYDAQAALNLLGKHHKLFTDNVDIGGTIGIKTYQTISPDDWDSDTPTE